MSQGPRGGWARRLMFGIGATLVVTVFGCNEIDKPRLGGTTKQPGPGLPGTPQLSGQPGSGNVRGGVSGTGMQPGGTAGTPVGRSPSTGYSAGGNTNFGTGTGAGSYVPSVAPSNTDYQPISSGPISPAAGMGAGSPSGSFGGAAAPQLDAPGLTPPAAPGAAGGVVTPPTSGPIPPSYSR